MDHIGSLTQLSNHCPQCRGNTVLNGNVRQEVGGLGGLVSEWLVCFSTCLLVFFLFHKLFSVNT